MTDNGKPAPSFLVIFDATINGQNCRTEVETIKNPMNSRSVRRECEDVARASFQALARQVGMKFDGKVKVIECIEFKPPEADGGH